MARAYLKVRARSFFLPLRAGDAVLVFQTPSASEGIQTEVRSGISLKDESG